MRVRECLPCDAPLISLRARRQISVDSAVDRFYAISSVFFVSEPGSYFEHITNIKYAVSILKLRNVIIRDVYKEKTKT